MTTQTYEVSENMKIKVTQCRGNLTIKGRETTEVSVRGAHDVDDLKVVQEGDALVIDSRADCQLICPHDFALNIEAVRGNLRVKELHGDLAIGEVNGDAILREVGAMTLQQIHGSLRAHGIAGALTVQSVAGDARVDGVAGEAKIERIGSDLRAGGLTAGLIAENVGADVRLDIPSTPGATYRVRAGSDLRVRLLEDANGSAATCVRFDLQAGSGVRSKVPTLELEETDGHVTGVLGETGDEGGECAMVKAQVGGQIVISAVGIEGEYVEDFDVNIDLSFLEGLDELGPMIEARVAEAMADLDVQLQKGLSFLESDRFREHVEAAAEKAERAAERISEKARVMVERETERARRAAEKEAQRARIRAEQAERRWQRASGRRSAPSAPAAPPEPAAPSAASSKESKREERMQVLRMVEEGKLSPDEAANLLQALQ